MLGAFGRRFAHSHVVLVSSKVKVSATTRQPRTGRVVTHSGTPTWVWRDPGESAAEAPDIEGSYGMTPWG